MRRSVGLVLVWLLVLLLVGLVPDNAAAEEETEPVRITVLYDNTVYDERLDADWGFAALIEIGEQTVLFDTGANGDILLSNMALMEVDPAAIDVIVLSHNHLDHTGGFGAVLEAGAAPDTIYVLPSFPSTFVNANETDAEVIDAEPGMEIVPGIFTTGMLTTGPVKEQAVVIETGDGLVIMTGCAHPGVVEIVQAVKDTSDEPIALVMGGFHLLETPYREINTIIEELQDLGVAQVGPSHCTGNLAIQRFRVLYEDDFVELGVGRVLEFEPRALEDEADVDVE